MKSVWFAILLLLTACGGPRYVDFFPFYDDGTAKPKVVLMSMKVPDCCAKSLDKELMSDIRYVTMDRGDLYLFPESDVKAWKSKNPNIDIHSRDIAWAKTFSCAEFVVVLEAVEVSTPTFSCGCDKSFIVIKMRIKIIDIRECEPKLVLYELMDSSQRVTFSKNSSKYGSDNYEGEYRMLVGRVVDRIEKIIWSVK